MLRKILTVGAGILLIAALFTGYMLKDQLNRFISGKMQEQAGGKPGLSAAEQIQENWNYKINRSDFRYTLLEFGSTGCVMCKQMEAELVKVRDNREARVNVVFLHIMDPDNQHLMKHFGISAVPMQVILDREGREIFRHYGVIAADKLLAECRIINN